MRKFVCVGLVLLIGQLAWVSRVSAELKLPAMFTDGAVLQQGMAVPVWGWADPDAEVKVTFAGQTKTAAANAEGKWMVTLDKLKANKTGTELSVNAGGESLSVKDVLVGEVWFCSGQSNMEWVVKDSVQPDFVHPDELPLIRHIKVPHVRAPEPAADFMGSWKVCNKENVASFTAVGFAFAYHIHKKLDVPVGLIGCNWGGTRIEPWTPPQGFEKVEELDVKTLQDTSTMYNGMVAAVQPYAIKGALWYQGESNGAEGVSYFHKMQAMIAGWRATWKQGDFPFYFVQLANFQKPTDDPAGGDGYANLRDAQLKAMKEIPQTGMACIIDIGEANDIHPKNKFDVGNRLALWALAKDYGVKDLVYSGPIYKSMKVNGDKVELTFDHVGSGLMAAKKSGPQSIETPKPVETLETFAIAGADKKWHFAQAKIEGDKVIVSSPEVKDPVAVRYAFAMNPDKANLYNKEGLPASPFRTDGW